MLALPINVENPFGYTARIDSVSEVPVAAIGTEKTNIVQIVVTTESRPLALPTQPGAELLVPSSVYTEDEYGNDLFVSNAIAAVYTFNCVQEDAGIDVPGRYNLDHAPVSDLDLMVGRPYTYIVELNTARTKSVLTNVTGYNITKILPIVGSTMVVKGNNYNALIGAEYAKALIAQILSPVGFLPTINSDGDLEIGAGYTYYEGTFITSPSGEVVEIDIDNVDEDEFAIVAVTLDLMSGALELYYGDSVALIGNVGEPPFPEEEGILNLCSVVISKADDGYGNIIGSIESGPVAAP